MKLIYDVYYNFKHCVEVFLALPSTY